MNEQDYYDPHRYNSKAHYRLYRSHRDEQPIVICVQDFDYYDYDANRILSSEAWDTEWEAEQALAKLVSRRVSGLPLGVIIADDFRRGELADIVIDPRTNVARAVKHPSH